MLGIGWPIRDGYGWGVFGLNLLLETLRAGGPEPVALGGAEVDGLSPEETELFLAWARRAPRPAPGRVPFTVLHALGNGLVGPPPAFRGRPDLGMVFLEDTRLDHPETRWALAAHDGFLAGSRWNAELLSAAGGRNVRATPQGVDVARFRPRPRKGRWAGRFVVFSGGKLELRKGQDLTVAAFARFVARHPDALLVTAWHSPWPALAGTLACSDHVRGPPRFDPSRNGLDLDRWLVEEGVPEGSFLNLGSLPNRAFPELLAECDVAVLPSRAEGGTNLVAMECLAAGVPTVLSANTGHLDLIETVPCLPLQDQAPVALPEVGTEGWGESDVDAIVAQLKRVYDVPDDARTLGREASRAMTAWAWAPQIAAMLDAVRDLAGAPIPRRVQPQ